MIIPAPKVMILKKEENGSFTNFQKKDDNLNFLSGLLSIAIPIHTDMTP